MRREPWLVVGLFCILLAQLCYGLMTDGVTSDEATYIGAGYRHLHGDFRVDPDHPPTWKPRGDVRALSSLHLLAGSA